MTEIERLTQERDDALLAMSALRDAWSAVHDGEHGNAAWMLGCAQAFAATPAALAGQVRARVLREAAGPLARANFFAAQVPRNRWRVNEVAAIDAFIAWLRHLADEAER